MVIWADLLVFLQHDELNATDVGIVAETKDVGLATYTKDSGAILLIFFNLRKLTFSTIIMFSVIFFSLYTNHTQSRPLLR